MKNNATDNFVKMAFDIGLGSMKAFAQFHDKKLIISTICQKISAAKICLSMQMNIK